MPAATPASPALCFVCESPGALQCGKCTFIRYCGKDHQAQDWSNHKLSCKVTKPEHFLVTGIPLADPNRDYFKGLPKQVAYAKLCDSFRMRVEDEGMYNGNLMSVMAGEDPLKPFLDFLSRAAARSRLPSWWQPSLDLPAITRFAMANNPYTIKTCADKAEMKEVWGNTGPMQLRMLAEMIYGTHVMGGGPMTFDA